MARANSKSSFNNVELRSANVIRRNGADGPEQYVRIVLHAEIPGASAHEQVHQLNVMGKDTLIVDFERGQKTLPGVEGGPKD